MPPFNLRDDFEKKPLAITTSPHFDSITGVFDFAGDGQVSPTIVHATFGFV